MSADPHQKGLSERKVFFVEVVQCSTNRPIRYLSIPEIEVKLVDEDVEKICQAALKVEAYLR